MGESNDSTDDAPDWASHVEDLNESFQRAFEQNVEAQTKFVNAWFDAVEDNTPEDVTDGMEGFTRAYEAWMAAADEQLERTQDLLEGEDVPIEDFRDIWLNTANEAFKEVMGTNAFAAATADAVGDIVDLQRQVDDAAEDTLHQLGFATRGDVKEVGERLVELERRQHDVETKLDELIDELTE